MGEFKPRTMKSGYAYECAKRNKHDVPAAEWWDCPNDAWDTVVYTPTGDEREVGTRFIDNARCVVFLCPDGKYRAQTIVMCESTK